MYSVDFYLQQQRQHVTTEAEARTACSVGHARGELGQVSLAVLHPEYGVHIYLAVLGIHPDVEVATSGCQKIPSKSRGWDHPCGEGKETADNGKGGGNRRGGKGKGLSSFLPEGQMTGSASSEQRAASSDGGWPDRIPKAKSQEGIRKGRAHVQYMPYLIHRLKSVQ